MTGGKDVRNMSSSHSVLQPPSIYYGTYYIPHYSNKDFSPIPKLNSVSQSLATAVI